MVTNPGIHLIPDLPPKREGRATPTILFPEQPKRGGSQGAIPVVLVLTVYQSPYNKTLGKDGILVCHENSIMHCHATNLADLFLLSVKNPDSRIDVCLWHKVTSK